MIEPDDPTNGGCCKYGTGYPTETLNFSLTNWVEFFVVNYIGSPYLNPRVTTPPPPLPPPPPQPPLHPPVRNQFHIIRFPYGKTIRTAAAQYATPDAYAAYKIITMMTDTIKVSAVSFEDLVVRFERYLFLKVPELARYVEHEDKMSDKLYDIYNVSYGIDINNQQSTIYFPVDVIRFPIQLPSRDKIFR